MSSMVIQKIAGHEVICPRPQRGMHMEMRIEHGTFESQARPRKSVANVTSGMAGSDDVE